MADQPRRPRTLADPRTEAEAAFKKVTTKPVEAPPPKKAAIPGAREQVTLRLQVPGRVDAVPAGVSVGEGRCLRVARAAVVFR